MVQEIPRDETILLEAGELRNIPFRFVIPDNVSNIGFRSPGEDGKSLQSWQMTLAPSFNSSTSKQHIATLKKPFGHIIYSISTTVCGRDGENNDGRTLVTLGQDIRQIFIKPRPSQIDLLDCRVFMPSKNITIPQTLRTGLLRRSSGSVSLKPVAPKQGLTCVGQVTSDHINEFRHELEVLLFDNLSPSKHSLVIKRVRGKLRMHTAYSLTPRIRIPDQLEQGTEREEKTFTLEIVRVSLHRVDGPEADNANPHQSRVKIDWKLRCSDDIAPSFSTLLISRWHELHFKFCFVNEYTGTGFHEISLRIPVKLCLQPSEYSTNCNPMTTLPSYTTLVSWGNEAHNRVPPY